MANSQQVALERLARLRDTGAISIDDYARLSSAICQPAGRERTPSRAAGFLENAGSIAAGVAVGSLAADMISNALASDEPQGFEYTATSETTWTDNGYATEYQETVEVTDATEGADFGDLDVGGFEV